MLDVYKRQAMTGIKLVMTEDMNYRNTSIVGLSVALGMGVTQAANSLAAFPDWATTIFGKSPVVEMCIRDSIMNTNVYGGNENNESGLR